MPHRVVSEQQHVILTKSLRDIAHLFQEAHNLVQGHMSQLREVDERYTGFTGDKDFLWWGIHLATLRMQVITWLRESRYFVDVVSPQEWKDICDRLAADQDWLEQLLMT